MRISLLLRHYVVAMVVTLAVVAAGGYLLEGALRWSIGWSAAFVIAMVPALDAGRVYARQAKARPTGGFMWTMAAFFVPIGYGLGLGMLFLIATLRNGPADAWSALASVGAGVWGLFLAVAFGVGWPAGRFFMGLGVRLALGCDAKRDARTRQST